MPIAGRTSLWIRLDKENNKRKDKGKIENLVSEVIEEDWWLRFRGKCSGKVVCWGLEQKVTIHPHQG